MHSEMAETIQRTAHQLMVQRGYAAFSYADISEAVGIRKASIHYHFPTKAGLAVAVLTAHRERLELAMGLLDDEIKDPLMRITAYVQHWENCILDRSMTFCVAALLGAEMPSLPEEVQVEVRKHFAILSQWIEKTLKAGAKAGVIRLEEKAATEAQILMAVVHGAMLSARASGIDEVYRTATAGALRRISKKSN
jgi:TetR/AcrR family transcriptional regulator, transcriptional repressor for nem operon